MLLSATEPPKPLSLLSHASTHAHVACLVAGVPISAMATPRGIGGHHAIPSGQQTHETVSKSIGMRPKTWQTAGLMQWWRRAKAY
jgi:hypothetical protein